MEIVGIMDGRKNGDYPRGTIGDEGEILRRRFSAARCHRMRMIRNRPMPGNLFIHFRTVPLSAFMAAQALSPGRVDSSANWRRSWEKIRRKFRLSVTIVIMSSM